MEQILWKEVKKLRASPDKLNIFTYLIGYYHTVLFQLAKYDDPDDIFQYHVLIRLGDLNRYLDRLDTAEYYYCNARNLYPNNGHAYNQLGILTKPENFYKCCYYYARAAKSSKRPLEKNLAESNLRIVIREHENSILNQISNDDSSIGTDASNKICQQVDSINDTLMPERVVEWFYVMVIAIYFDNIQPIARPFMTFMSENFSTQRSTIVRNGLAMTTVHCDRDSYLLLASLDILLDWSRLGKQGKTVSMKISNELRQMRACLESIADTLIDMCRHQTYLTKDAVVDDPIVSMSALSEDSECSPIRMMSIKSFSGPGNSTPLMNSSSKANTAAAGPNTSDASPNSSLAHSITRKSSETSGLLSTSASKTIKSPALPHDFVLRGFKPLDVVHEELHFPRELPIFDGFNGKLDEFGNDVLHERGFIGPEQLIQILTRIRAKIDSLNLKMRRKTAGRNIALESIMSNMSSFTGDR